MARSLSNTEPARNGKTGDSSATNLQRRTESQQEALRAAGLETLGEGEGLQDELGRLAEETQAVRAALEDQLRETAATPGGEELERLRQENERYAQRAAELERILEQAEKEQLAWESRQREYEGLLEEKSEVIRELHRKLHEQPERPAGSTPREEELIALSEELERERRQLKDDEAALMEQMRQMEVQMSRERAEMARQRNELQRLQNDLRHELELATRDATLRDRLAPLQRRHQEMTNRTGGAPRHHEAPAAAAPAAAPAQTSSKESGLFRRLFG
jgi:colicin import membrane protein